MPLRHSRLEGLPEMSARPDLADLTLLRRGRQARIRSRDRPYLDREVELVDMRQRLERIANPVGVHGMSSAVLRNGSPGVQGCPRWVTDRVRVTVRVGLSNRLLRAPGRVGRFCIEHYKSFISVHNRKHGEEPRRIPQVELLGH